MLLSLPCVHAWQSNNPYQLETGTVYYVLTVSAVEWGSSLPSQS